MGTQTNTTDELVRSTLKDGKISSLDITAKHERSVSKHAGHPRLKSLELSHGVSMAAAARRGVGLTTRLNELAWSIRVRLPWSMMSSPHDNANRKWMMVSYQVSAKVARLILAISTF